MQPVVKREPNTNFADLIILKALQALGDQESFALGHNQSFMTNTHHSGQKSSCNFLDSLHSTSPFFNILQTLSDHPKHLLQNIKQKPLTRINSNLRSGKANAKASHQAGQKRFSPSLRGGGFDNKENAELVSPPAMGVPLRYSALLNVQK